MKQYTRIYMNSLGEITHVHTQTTPIRDGFEPVEVTSPPKNATPEQSAEWHARARIEHVWDVELEDDGEFVHAGVLLDSLESRGAENVPAFAKHAKRKMKVDQARKRG